MLEGRLLNERYVVKKLIGGGGMANVYLGFDNILEREVAIKVLRLEYSNDDEFITRFHREAQSATSLSHPNIVNIYDVGEEDDIYYMVMEYVDGLTLKEYIQRFGPISIDDAVDIMLQITSAIEHAHANHIVHRDIKPQNILINDDRTVKVTDFGIALALTATSLTQTNSVLGSVHYLSPEQARGGTANRKSDIYSLGIVMYELLTGRIPFTGQSAVSIALKHLESPLPSMREWDPLIPQSLENIVLKATTKDPFQRYQRVIDFEKDLETALDPDRINEQPFIPPSEPGDQTKAIPIIMDNQLTNEQTIANQQMSQDTTRPIGVKDSQTKQPRPKKKKMSKKKKVAIWLSSIFVVIVGAILVALFVLPALTQPDDIELEDFTEMHVDDVIERLEELNLDYEIEEIFSEDIEAEHVESTDPEAGSIVKEGSIITLFVSQGIEPVPLSDYEGQSYSQVERLLIQKGFAPENIQRVDSHSSEFTEGQIISQQPEAGSQVNPADTVIVFEVSIGERKVVLEDLEDMTIQAATQYLEDRGLIANVTEEHSSTYSEGRVIRHSPQAGEELESGSIVNLIVSLGEEELSPVTHTLKVTVPYTGDANLPEPDEGEDDEGEAPAPVSQQVRIYISDMNNELTDLYEQSSINSDTEFTIRLVIAPNSTATYKIERDDQVIVQKTIAYDEVDGG
ncbi:MAG TPA: Stk1 family PASTA domain-containing Ser/Thr kinase [Bacilli bacterium]|nr:Stk1 family PASTA domain-containing Ser/Thr kinase [Bacilli bacterium]